MALVKVDDIIMWSSGEDSFVLFRAAGSRDSSDINYDDFSLFWLSPTHHGYIMVLFVLILLLLVLWKWSGVKVLLCTEKQRKFSVFASVNERPKAVSLKRPEIIPHKKYIFITNQFNSLWKWNWKSLPLDGSWIHWKCFIDAVRFLFSPWQ